MDWALPGPTSVSSLDACKSGSGGISSTLVLEGTLFPAVGDGEVPVRPGEGIVIPIRHHTRYFDLRSKGQGSARMLPVRGPVWGDAIHGHWQANREIH